MRGVHGRRVTRASDHDRDFFTWANEQARLLRAGHLADAGVGNVAAELESLAQAEKRALTSMLGVVMVHLLKWQYQPGLRGKSWSATIRAQRNALRRHLRDNPWLNGKIDEAVTAACADALIEAEAETGLPGSVLPASCPWPFEQVMDAGFRPEDG